MPIVIGGGAIVITAADILGISVCVCLITPSCLELVAQLTAKAVCEAACSAAYAADAAACAFAGNARQKAVCYQRAMQDYANCLAGC